MEMTNTTVETMPVVSQPGNPESAATLADVIGVAPEADTQVQSTSEPQQNTVPAQEPGWYAERRQKDRAKWEAENQAKMAPVLSQMAKLQEYFIGAEADKLVASGKITDREIALEYVRLQEGAPSTSTPDPAQSKPRDAQGRFAAKNTEPDADAKLRATRLVAQADNIKSATGVDVMHLYDTDPDIRAKILSGEWDFTNVLTAHQTSAPNTPAPVRSANGLGVGGVSISAMSDAQFDRLNEILDRGGKIDVRR